jgi:hypothetical protein
MQIVVKRKLAKYLEGGAEPATTSFLIRFDVTTRVHIDIELFTYGNTPVNTFSKEILDECDYPNPRHVTLSSVSWPHFFRNRAKLVLFNDDVDFEEPALRESHLCSRPLRTEHSDALYLMDRDLGLDRRDSC